MMEKVRITVMRKACYPDLMARYENPIDNPCDMAVGMEFVSVDGNKPEGLCQSAWLTMEPFVKSLARGQGNFYDGWMRDPYTALLSCNDGFRPVSFLLQLLP